MTKLTKYNHIPVMLSEAIAALNVKPEGVYVDGTFGCGGHAKAILNKLGFSGKLIVIDLDLDAIKIALELQQQDPRVTVVHGSFKDLAKICAKFKVDALDGILLDLGVSSVQLDDNSKGFSFNKEGPLDLRMNSGVGISARQWLDEVELKELVQVLKSYGQEKFAQRIATAIVTTRKSRPIVTTLDLANLIKAVYPLKYHKKHPATKTFQAIRIYLNQELVALELVLPEILKLLKPHGRLVVISFHSLEDVIVKEFVSSHSKIIRSSALRKLPLECWSDLTASPKINLRNIGKFKPTLEEINLNKRSRSAIMRVAEKCG